MLRLRASFFYLLAALLLTAGGLAGQTNRVFLFPSGGSSNVTVLDATTLANAGVIQASPNAFQVLGVPDGSKYYVIANNVSRTITVVNASNLTITRQIDLGVNASSAAITPDGRRLLVAAGTLRIYDTSNDTEVGSVAVGGGPTEIDINNTSTRAYVMSPGSGLISVVNLTNNTLVNQIAVGAPLAMALTPSDARLVVLTPGAVQLVNTANNNLSNPISIQITAGDVQITPDSTRAIIVNRSFAPSNISQILDLRSLVATPIGGGLGFDSIAIADDSLAFGIVNGTNSVARIDLTTGSATVQTYGANTRAIDVSPNGKYAYLASFSGSSITRIDVVANLAAGSQTVGIPPSGTTAVFPPPTTGAANMVIVGGDRQSLVAGQTTTFPLVVRVTTSDGSPVFNLPVTFSTTATGATFSPAQPVSTNSRGIAEAFLTTAAPAASLQVDPATGIATASAPQTISEAASSSDSGEVSQEIQNISVTVSAPGVPGVTFTIVVGSGSGITAVSGSYQITRPSQAFPLPLVVRVTGADGFPLPAGTTVSFFASSFGVFPPSLQTTTDAEGFARAQFSGGQIPPGSLSATTLVLASVDGRGDLGNASFILTTSVSLPGAPEILSGDGQTGEVGAILPGFLCVQLTSQGFGSGGSVGVYWEVLSGPAGTSSASVNPAITITNLAGQACTQVTIGPRPGEGIVIRAYVPGITGEARFTLRATGGPPQRINKLQGDNQEGRPGQTLPLALRVQVLDFFNNPFPLPNQRYPLAFSVEPSGAATLSEFFQQTDGQASVRVTIGNYNGAFRVVATAGDGQAVFNLRAASSPSQLVRVSGDSQSVSIGGTTANRLTVRVNDTQGNAVPGIQVTFSGPSSVSLVPAQGAAGNPLSMNTASDGTAAVAVRPNAGTPLGNITITATASSGGTQIGTPVSFTVTVVGRTPTFTAAAIVNAASFVPGMVPGGLATLFGTGLSEISGRAFPGGATSHQGVSIRISGQAVPLYLVLNEGGQEQINFQVRTDLTAPSTVTVEVVNNGATTTVSNVPVLRFQPGVFEYTPSGGSLRYAAAVKPDGAVVGPTNRVPRGGFFSIFLTGMGPTNPPLLTGQVGPVPPALTVFQPVVGLANRGAEVVFSGMAPGLIIYQINVRVPEDAVVGDSVALDIGLEGVFSQTSRVAIGP